MKFCQSTFIKSVIESVSMIKYILKFEENSFDVFNGVTYGPKTNLKGIYKFLLSKYMIYFNLEVWPLGYSKILDSFGKFSD